MSSRWVANANAVSGGIWALEYYVGTNQSVDTSGGSGNCDTLFDKVCVSCSIKEYYITIIIVGSDNRITVTERIKAPFLV